VTIDKSEPVTTAKQNDFSDTNGGGGFGGGVLSDLFNIISQRRVAIKHDSESEDSIENDVKVSDDNVPVVPPIAEHRLSDPMDSNYDCSPPSEAEHGTNNTKQSTKALHVLTPSNLGLKISIAGIHGPTSYTNNHTPQPAMPLEELDESALRDNPPLDLNELIDRLSHFDFKNSTTMYCGMHEKKKKQIITAEREREKEKEKNRQKTKTKSKSRG